MSQPGHIASCSSVGLTTSRPSALLPASASRYPEDMSKRYRCSPCGHIYDPAEGAPAAGIPPGTSFESLPEDWYCPDCGASKADFEPLED